MNLNLLQNPDGHNMDVMAERLNHIINIIDTNSVKVLLEIGSMDAWESVNMARVFTDATIYAFEPVPFNANRCRANIANHPDVSNRIYLHEIAMNNVTGLMTFWALDVDEASRIKSRVNHGIGSKFKLINPDMWRWEHNKQKAISVQGYRLEDWCDEFIVPKVDGIWMDAQGAELEILEGAGDILNNVQFIITEAGIKPYYAGHNMKHDIDKYLYEKGFREYLPAREQAHEYEVNVIYLNTKFMV